MFPVRKLPVAHVARLRYRYCASSQATSGSHQKLSIFRFNARNFHSCVFDSLVSRPGASTKQCRFSRPFSSTRVRKSQPENSFNAQVASATRSSCRVPIPLDGDVVEFSPILLRDACSCPACVHESTRQRLFSVADIPANIQARNIEVDIPSDTVTITWNNDLVGYGEEHTTTLNIAALQSMKESGYTPGSQSDNFPAQVMWSKKALNLPDYPYEQYMEDDSVLYQLVKQLRTDGLAFVTNVPGLRESLAKIATRIGPVKDTFYGHTWDVRTVPEAINAAYTSHDLGFHTDLLYFHQPPHVQLLHCVQSASSGGASVFADAYKAVVDLYHADKEAFNTLATVPVNYHYTHPESNVYHTTKPVIDLCSLRIGNVIYTRFQDYLKAMKSHSPSGISDEWEISLLVKCLQKVNWGPPFFAPFSNHDGLLPASDDGSGQSALSALNDKADQWHHAACKFNALLQRPEYLYERKMDPGDCVLFDNTRTLHSRRAFDMADVGKPRWLRGTYVDKDPYLSKLRVLQAKFE